ncbi:MAG: hypothetical protein GY765_06190, partial [bacterium]|nr:hypothetical protein [bacterium]
MWYSLTMPWTLKMMLMMAVLAAPLALYVGLRLSTAIHRLLKLSKNFVRVI